MEFVGDNIRQLRELNGLSRKELANKLATTEQTISQYENNKIIPNIGVFNKLSNEFNVSSQYFLKRSCIDKYVTSEEHVAYRADDRSSRKKTKFELQYLNFVDYYINYFESFLKVPQNNIDELQKESTKILNSVSNRSVAIDKVANIARDFLEITDNRNLMFNLEKSGIYILEKKNLGHTIDAYSTLTDNGRPFIVLGTYRKSAVRRTFDLAHELGHILLHQDVDMAILEKEEYKAVEKEASEFASALLLPKDQFLRDCGNLNHFSNPLSYISLKKKYYVSIAALEMRAYKLGLLTYQQNRLFYAKINKLDYKNIEPLDDKWAPIKPGKVKAMMDMVFEHGLMPISDITNKMYISKKFLIDLFDLKESYFDKFESEIKSYYKTESNIIKLF